MVTREPESPVRSDRRRVGLVAQNFVPPVHHRNESGHANRDS